jgi:hypothetical protein
MLRDQLDDARGQRDKWEQAAQMALRQLPGPKRPTTLVVAETPCGMIGVRVFCRLFPPLLPWFNSITSSPT